MLAKRKQKTSERTEIDAKFPTIIPFDFLPQLCHARNDGHTQKDVVDTESGDSVVSAVTTAAAAAAAAAGRAGVTTTSSRVGGLNVALAGCRPLDDLLAVSIGEKSAESRDIGGGHNSAATGDCRESRKLNTLQK